MEIEIIETKYLCPVCQKDFKNTAEKNIHIKVKHKNSGSYIYKCKKCEKTFRNPFALSSHLKLKKCASHINNRALLDERRKLLKANNDLKRQMGIFRAAGVILKRELVTKGNST